MKPGNVFMSLRYKVNDVITLKYQHTGYDEVYQVKEIIETDVPGFSTNLFYKLIKLKTLEELTIEAISIDIDDVSSLHIPSMREQKLNELGL